ncbi:L-lactate dehydrogenase [Sphingomonas lacunae]|uniref:L-lactate dehydrogenase n=1 Tax=Sphingomonas lacunae TaxID=2698828 RepID=A0A6M4AW95_9SPHN|nr:L-lactate dehydrogenase [Sphingomonas lacunae]QJQ32582.1 L-lactate dehydrogenase [Sphingomonas lacunae]
MPPPILVPATVSDYRREAQRRLPTFLFDYLDGAAGEEVSLQRNEADFRAIQLEQRVLRDVSAIDTGVDLFGTHLDMPVVLAPIGMGGMMARRAEVLAKRAADAAGIDMCLSTVGICSVEEVSAVSGRPIWFQLYMLRDRGVVQELLDRAWASGVRTLTFTVDLPVVGARYRDVRNGMAGGTSALGRFRAGLGSYLMHPRWLWDVGIRGAPHSFGNLAAYVPGAASPNQFKAWVDKQFDPSTDWNDIAWLRSVWKGHLLLKGILNAEDAVNAVDQGADGIIVSNHGGRQLDGVASGIAVLPEIAAAVSGRCTLLVDGGVRNGQDVVKALALGAQAVMVGRPWVYAVAARGEAGLKTWLSAMKNDMRTAFALTGIRTVADIDRSMIRQGL